MQFALQAERNGFWHGEPRGQNTASRRSTTMPPLGALQFARITGQRAAARGRRTRVRVLIVKMSSMGDVVHALPALTDMQRHVPGLEVDWLVEEAFAAIPALHNCVRHVIPLAWREWRKRLGSATTWRTMAALRRDVRREAYDLVIDLQGLVKSAWWGWQARGPMAGYDRRSAREALASVFYARKATVSRQLHAVERCRRLAAAHMGYAIPSSEPEFGIRATEGRRCPQAPYAVLIPCASRREKLWPEPRWIAVGQQLSALGWSPVVLWGSATERQSASRIAAGCAGVVPPFLSIKDAAMVLAGARCVVGLDTGFTHLGAALGRPTVGIYCDHEPGLAGISGSGPVASVGGKGTVPSLRAVMRVLEDVQRSSGVSSR